MNIRTIQLALLVNLCMLVACGGGGSSAPTAAPPPAAPEGAACCAANQSPVPVLQASPNGLLVSASADGSTDPDGTIVGYAWNFGEPASGADNTASDPTATHAYRSPGSFTVTLTLTDNGGTAASRSIQVTPAAPAAGATGRLNDTGITPSQCHVAANYEELVNCSHPHAVALSTTPDGLTGRDANPGTNSAADGKLGFSFTKLGDSGQTLPASATSWSCVRDEVTGLMWEIKSVDNGPRDLDKAYTNFSAAFDPNRSFGSATDATGYVSAVNASGLCGADDWRLPSVHELQGLTDFGAGPNQPQIDAAWFPRTGLNNYWTGTPVAGDPSFASDTDRAWYVASATGVVWMEKRQTTLRIRLVRGAALPASPMTTSADGQEITDERTRLIWRRCSEGTVWNAASGGSCIGTMELYAGRREAAARQRAQAAATGKAWRIPNVKELLTINNATTYNPSVDPAIFPNTDANYPYWSSTPGALTPNAFPDQPGDWMVQFIGGTSGAFRFVPGRLRLVRDAQ